MRAFATSGTRRGQGKGKRMATIRLTAAQAMVRYLSAQKNEDGERFLAGWSPGHRSSRFAAAQTALALAP